METGIRGITVCVNYWDYLEITLKHNRHHFEDFMVVTDTKDQRTPEIARLHNCKVFCTDLFYLRGAYFNKWLALETALEEYGRHGWMCIMDADILWPKKLPSGFSSILQKGNLYTPLRRMFTDMRKPIPFKEKDWEKYPIHKNINEWAGYSQIFHANDPHLPNPPWHETNWKHAGGADSFFQQKWPRFNKIRPQFEVLHLGPAGSNWAGRASTFLDGTEHDEAKMNRDRLKKIASERRTGKASKDGDRFWKEKIH